MEKLFSKYEISVRFLLVFGGLFLSPAVILWTSLTLCLTGEYFFLFYLNIEMYENQKKRHSFVKLKNVTKENTLF